MGIAARTGQANEVEIFEDSNSGEPSVSILSPAEAALFAREVLSAAVMTAGPNPPKPGTIVGSAAIPITGYDLKSLETGTIEITLHTVAGLKLPFVILSQNARQLAVGLAHHAQDAASLQARRGRVH